MSHAHNLQNVNGSCHPGDWQTNHIRAINKPRGPEVAIASMLKGWLIYADLHKNQYESGIGEDGVLGDHWASIGVALRGLLNGECGRLDCGTLDSLILDTLAAEGFNEDGRGDLLTQRRAQGLSPEPE